MQWLSLIIPVHWKPGQLKTGQALFEKLLLSLTRVKTLPEISEVIVVDNHTRPVSQLHKLVSQYREQIKLKVYHEPQLNPGVARNRGASLARYPWLAFIDADEELPNTWLVHVQQALTDVAWNPEVVIHGPYHNIFPYRPSWLASELERLFGRNLPARSSNPRRLLTQLAGGNFVIARNTFLKEGGFLPLPRAQDTELGLRLMCRGYQGIFLPEAFVYHHIHQSKISLRYLGKLYYLSNYYKAIIFLYHFYKAPFTWRARASMARQCIRSLLQRIRQSWRLAGRTYTQRFAMIYVWSVGIYGCVASVSRGAPQWLARLQQISVPRCIEQGITSIG